MTFYDVVETNKQIKWEDRFEIKKGCTLDGGNATVLQTHDVKEWAIDELRCYQSTIEEISNPNGNTFIVTEFSIQEIEVNEETDDQKLNGVLGLSSFNKKQLEKFQETLK